MNTSTTRTYYLRSIPHTGQKRGDPIACLMTTIDRTNKTIKYAISASHPKDEFRKELGRKIAAGRLENCPKTLLGDIPTSGHDINRLIMEDIVERVDMLGRFKQAYIERTYGRQWDYYLPVRVGKAAQRWLDEAHKPKSLPREEAIQQFLDNQHSDEKVRVYKLEQKEARVFTERDLEGKIAPGTSLTASTKETRILTAADLQVKPAPGTSLTMTIPLDTHHPITGEMVSMPVWEYDDWVAKVYSTPSIPEKEEKKAPKSLSKTQQLNYKYFRANLSSLMADKLLRGKFAIIHNQDLHSVYDTFENAFKKTFDFGLKSDEYLIQEIPNKPEAIFNNGLANASMAHSPAR